MKSQPVQRKQVEAAIAHCGFDHWVSPLDSPLLDRPMSRPDHLSGEGHCAAVMALLIADAEERCTKLVLIRRSQQLRHHAGQMALPGGRQDPGEDLLQTAIRETQEEIGVFLNRDNVVGELRSIYLPPSDFTLKPYVAWLDKAPSFELAPDEVDEMIAVPIQSLMEPTAQSLETVVRDDGEPMQVPCYRFNENIIWGATALVISELVARLKVVAGHAG